MRLGVFQKDMYKMVKVMSWILSIFLSIADQLKYQIFLWTIVWVEGEFKNVAIRRTGLLPPIWSFYVAKSISCLNYGLSPPLQETAHVGFCEKGRRFLLFSGQDQEKSFKYHGQGDQMARTVLVYIYYPGVIFIKAPFPKCPSQDHTLLEHTRHRRCRVCGSPRPSFLETKCAFTHLHRSLGLTSGAHGVLSYTFCDDHERALPGQVTHLIYQTWCQGMQLLPRPAVCRPRYNCTLPQCPKAAAR